ncbi:MAG: DUF1499 domain-containing protein [Pseudomonadota bacterium]
MLDFEGFKRSRRPNNYLLAPPNVRTDGVDGPGPEFSVSPETLKSALIDVLKSEPRMQILQDEGLALEVVQRSALMRFPDFISIRIYPSEAGGASLAIYSRAKYGYRDFGVNQKRVENWMAALKKAAEAAS